MKFATCLFLPFALAASSGALCAEQGVDSQSQLDASALVCKLDQQAAVSAVAMRDKGKTKEEMAKVLPERGPKNNRMAQLMYEILDDIYETPEIKAFPYYIFRTEVCFRETQKKSKPVGFKVVVSDILECQKKHGAGAGNEIIDCIRKAVIKGAAIEQ
jgi:hypothetical protein